MNTFITWQPLLSSILTGKCFRDPLHMQARSQVRKRGGSGKKNVDPKWAWVTKRGRVREGEVPPPAPRAEAFENIDLATKKN